MQRMMEGDDFLKPNEDTVRDDSTEDENDSADEALCEFLGISSLNCFEKHNVGADDNPTTSEKPLPYDQHSINELASLINDAFVQKIIRQEALKLDYEHNGFCQFPCELTISPTLIRRLTDELVWGGSLYQNMNRTYETIRTWKNNEIIERRTLTRIENISRYHDGWNKLCQVYIRKCISLIFGEEMVLFKEKLNLKPGGGSGFAPHLDTPSLRLSLGKNGPQTFVTVMIAVDNMTIENGCLRLVRGKWSEENACTTIQPNDDGNPDADGRAGAIPSEIANELNFEDVICTGGSIVAFNGWVPHRSNGNKTNFPRRAVFLTYNPASEGDFYHQYYEKMDDLRKNFRAKVGLHQQKEALQDVDTCELEALSTIPKI